MSRRRLRPDELELWQQIARSTDPLHKRARHRAEAAPKSARPDPAPEPEPRAAFEPFRVGEAASPRRAPPSVPPATGQRLNSEPVRMDNKAFNRLKRGKLSPDARIDLHGLKLDEAHPRLIAFIMGAQNRGARLALVITGKGGGEDPYAPMPHRRGILKRQVPLWLNQPPAAQAVLQIAPAHIRHGGDGAYYVYLRKRR